MQQQDDLHIRAALDFAQLLRKRGIEAEVYNIPDAKPHELVLRVAFEHMPSLQERITVGDAMGDLMARYPVLSIDLMTLNPEELGRYPLPKSAVRAEWRSL